MGQSWLIPVAALLVGGGGVGTFLGLVVQRRQNTMVNNATLVGHAIDGLAKLAEQRGADLDEARAEIVELKKQLRAARRTTR